MLEDRRQPRQVPSETDLLYDYQNDGANTGVDDDEDAESDTGGVNNSSAPPRILTTGLIVEAAEGTTVNLPCKVSERSCKFITVFKINHINSTITLLVFLGRVIYFGGWWVMTLIDEARAPFF